MFDSLDSAENGKFEYWSYTILILHLVLNACPYCFSFLYFDQKCDSWSNNVQAYTVNCDYKYMIFRAFHYSSWFLVLSMWAVSFCVKYWKKNEI